MLQILNIHHGTFLSMTSISTVWWMRSRTWSWFIIMTSMVFWPSFTRGAAWVWTMSSVSVWKKIQYKHLLDKKFDNLPMTTVITTSFMVVTSAISNSEIFNQGCKLIFWSNSNTKLLDENTILNSLIGIHEFKRIFLKM